MTSRKSKRLLATVAVTVAVVFTGLVTACAPQAADSAKGLQHDEQAVAVSWSSDSDCAMCHAFEVASQEDAACLASKHAATACIDCHDDADTLAIEHEGVTSEDKTPKRLKKTGINEDLCLSCHTDVAEKTADFAGLVDVNGKVVNPHALPATPDHENIPCSDCHSMHDSSAQTLETAQLKCISCHHEDVFECGTCHAQ